VLPGAVVEAGIVANCDRGLRGGDESRRILVVGMKVVLKTVEYAWLGIGG
jgi:hypothetical protein